jgi:hypothetical protein
MSFPPTSKFYAHMNAVKILKYNIAYLVMERLADIADELKGYYQNIAAIIRELGRRDLSKG